ncbi:MAG: hypothetical protein ACK4OI_10285, partial [Rhizobium oryzihabitans]
TSLRENRIRPNTAFTRNILTSSTPPIALTPKRGSKDEEHTRDEAQDHAVPSLAIVPLSH